MGKGSEMQIHSFFYRHTGKLSWSSICLRFSQFEPEIMLDGMLNFKTHFMVWYCIWYEHCNGLFNIQNLVSSLILMFVRTCLCDTILYTWFVKKWKRSKERMLISFMLRKKKSVLDLTQQQNMLTSLVKSFR